MKIIKRNGAEVQFDPSKISVAIGKANSAIDEKNRISDAQIAAITAAVVVKCNALTHTPSVEEVQDMVELELHNSGSFEISKEYITYRYKRNMVRNHNTTDDKILSLIDCNNEEVKQENSNKNPAINAVQRDYMAGEISKDLTTRILLPKDVVEAHNEGIIHFHDSDYYAQRMHNCFHSKTRFYTSDGVHQFADFHDGAAVQVLDCNGVLRTATVHKYEPQPMYRIKFKAGCREKEVVCTRNHRWLLHDGTVTTNINVGDRLMGVQKTNICLDPNYMGPYLCRIFALGMVIGDGCDRYNKNCHTIRLCGNKIKYANILAAAGYKISTVKNSSDVVAYMHGCIKQDFLNNCGWLYMDATSKMYLFAGLYAADGATNANMISTSDYRVIEMIYNIAHHAGYYISSIKTEVRDTNYKKNAILTMIRFVTSQPINILWKVQSIELEHNGHLYDTWCVEEPVTHSFMLEEGMITGNCDLINLDDMLQNGTVISGTMIEKPHSFSTACNIATQIIAQVASNQYGGQSISLTHLAPFVDISRKKIRKQVEKEYKESSHIVYGGELIELSDAANRAIDKITEDRLRDEVKRGVQTIQYQVVTLMTTNGQAPFITVFMYLNEARNEQEKKDLALIIEETLEQRYQGVKNEAGVWISPAFPKLVYVLEDDNTYPGSEYYYLTKIAAKCTAKRLVPDYISEKKMKEYKLSKGETEGNGDVYTPMGCRSFLTPDRSGNGFNNIARAKNYEPGKPKYYGRFNQGVVTINLVDVALSSEKDVDKFWKIFDERLELCHKALMCRHNRLKGTLSDAAPILWQYGALARLDKGEKIDPLLYGGYSTISLGYAGLYECVRYMTEKSHTDDEAKPFALSVMQHMNDMCAKWKAESNIDFSVYGTPLESTTYKFAKCLQRRFGIIEGITDKNYITNSYHVHVTEKIDAFTKLRFESEFQKLSPGGAISYVEVPNMQNNIDAVLSIMQYIYENIMYAELNTKSDYCHICGYDGEIVIDTNDDGKLIWRCPQCGNTDQTKMNVCRRTCGKSKQYLPQ